MKIRNFLKGRLKLSSLDVSIDTATFVDRLISTDLALVFLVGLDFYISPIVTQNRPGFVLMFGSY